MSRDLTEALQALTVLAGDPRRPPLPDPRLRGAAPHAIGASLLPGGSDGGGSIASPLTEEYAEAREYYPAGWKSSDGLFVLPAIKTIVFIDANGNSVEFHFAEPAPIEDES